MYINKLKNAHCRCAKILDIGNNFPAFPIRKSYFCFSLYTFPILLSLTNIMYYIYK